MAAVTSSAISHIEYNKGTRVMTVQFTSGGKRYTFHDVPEAEYEAFHKAESKGSHFHKHIRGRFAGPGK